MTKPLRQAMPETAAFIDACRAAFGADTINAAIKAGINGQPTFWASENGQEVGTKAPCDKNRAVSLSDIQIDRQKPTTPHHVSRRTKWTT